MARISRISQIRQYFVVPDRVSDNEWSPWSFILVMSQNDMSRVSRYNHFQRWRDGYYIAFNARTGAVALMTEDNYQTYLNLAEKVDRDNGSGNLTSMEQELLSQLEHGRFMNAEDCDELSILKFQHDMSRYDLTKLGLVIAPTLACNMACPYCYEANKSGRMSRDVMDAVIKMIRDQSMNLNQLDVTWYGGEPLLAMDMVEELSRTFIALGKEMHFAYTSAVITNGYLMNKDVVDLLADLKVVMCQVTLDGPARLHNLKRPLKNGKDTFQTIVRNLDYATTKLPIAIRVNVDKTMRIEDISELLSELQQAGLQGRVAIGFGQLEPASSTCAAIAETCYETADFSRVEIDYYRLLLDNGFFAEKLPSPNTLFCMAHRVNSFLIDPGGYLYRCLNHVGDVERSMGNVQNEINYQNANFMNLFEADPFASESCRSCTILPICMGGCPAQHVDRGFTDEQLCNSWKHNLMPMLEIIARSRQQKAPTVRKEQP